MSVLRIYANAFTQTKTGFCIAAHKAREIEWWFPTLCNQWLKQEKTSLMKTFVYLYMFKSHENNLSSFFTFSLPSLYIYFFFIINTWRRWLPVKVEKKKKKGKERNTSFLLLLAAWPTPAAVLFFFLSFFFFWLFFFLFLSFLFRFQMFFALSNFHLKSHKKYTRTR